MGVGLWSLFLLLVVLPPIVLVRDFGWLRASLVWSLLSIICVDFGDVLNFRIAGKWVVGAIVWRKAAAPSSKTPDRSRCAREAIGPAAGGAAAAG